MVEAFILQQLEVVAVATHHQGALTNHFTDVLASLLVGLDDLDVHVLGKRPAGAYGQFASTDDHHIADVGVGGIVLTGEYLDMFDVVAEHHEEHQIFVFDDLFAIRADGFAAALDGHHMELPAC